MEAKLYGQNKGGTTINGIIKDYYVYAGENISVGDLVEYVNGAASKVNYGQSNDVSLGTTTHTGYSIAAVQLDGNRVFIAHNYSSSYCLYGVVCTINGASITYGADTQLSGTDGTGKAISLELLPNGNIFIAHSYGSSNHLYGMVVSISGTTITKGNDTAINNTTSNSGYAISTKLLANGNVFVAHSYGSNYYLYGIVCSINGTTIAKGNDTSISTANRAGVAISTCSLDNGNIFIAHSYSTNFHLYAVVCTINGDSITYGTDTALVSVSNGGGAVSACAMPNGDVFIAHSYGSNYHLYGIVCTINGTTISMYTDTLLNNSTNAGIKINSILLNNGDILIIHSYSNEYYMAGIVCDVNMGIISAGTDTILNANSRAGYQIFTILLNNGTAFVAHSYNTSYYLYSQICGVDYGNNIPTNNIVITEYETQVRKVTTAKFDGVAKTEGVGGDETAHNEMVSIWTKE